MFIVIREPPKHANKLMVGPFDWVPVLQHYSACHLQTFRMRARDVHTTPLVGLHP